MKILSTQTISLTSETLYPEEEYDVRSYQLANNQYYFFVSIFIINLKYSFMIQEKGYLEYSVNLFYQDLQEW